MTIEQFFQALLESQKLSEEQRTGLEEHRAEVEGYLREKFGQAPIIRYGGSKAKGTMIAESYDLDIICYFPQDEERTLEEIYNEVLKVLQEHYTVEPKTSAIRIKKIDGISETDYHIDVVPGRFVEGDSGDAFLHMAFGGKKERIQTNIDTHIAYVMKSGCQDIIKLIKLWKSRNNIPLRTFVLEIFTIKSLEGFQEKNVISKAVREVLEKIRDEITNVRLEDPANSNNIVSQIITDGEKNMIAKKASEAISALDNCNGDEIAAWSLIFDEDEKIDRGVGPTIITNPRKPWVQ